MVSGVRPILGASPQACCTRCVPGGADDSRSDLATAVTGDLQVPGLSQLPKGIQLSIRLLDVTDPSQVAPVVAEINEPAPALLPHRFRLGYDASKIKPEGRYAVQAALLAGTAPLYSTAEPVAVLTQGAGDQLVLQLVRGGAEAATQMAPTDKLKKDFAELEGKIGGFRRVTGERIDEKVTIGWDAFVSAEACGSPANRSTRASRPRFPTSMRTSTTSFSRRCANIGTSSLGLVGMPAVS